MKEQFGSIRWRSNSLFIDYYVNGKRNRVKFGTLRNGTRKEKRILEGEARRHLNQIELDIRDGKFFDSQEDSQYPTFKQMALFYWEKCHLLKPYIKNDNINKGSDWCKLQKVINGLGSERANKITHSELKNFRRKLNMENQRREAQGKKPWKNAYINKFIDVVGQVYKFCKEQEIWDYSDAPIKERERYGKDLEPVLLQQPHGTDSPG